MADFMTPSGPSRGTYLTGGTMEKGGNNPGGAGVATTFLPPVNNGDPYQGFTESQRSGKGGLDLLTLTVTSPRSWSEGFTSLEGLLEEEGNLTAPANKTGMNMYAFHQREQIVFIIVLFIFIVVGNLSVLIAIGLSKRGQRSRMNFFIMHLAIADLSCGIFSVMTDMVWKITLQWYAGNVICKIARYLQAVVTYGSTYVLVSLSIDRLDAIARPMHFSGSGTRAKVLIILAWSLAAVFSLPMTFINTEKIMPDGTTQCHMYLPEPWHWKLYFTLIAVVLFIIPAFIIAICYITIIVIIWSKSKVMTPTTAPTRGTFKRFTTKQNGLKPESKCLGGDTNKSSSSSRGVIPQAKIRTIKMTLVIVMVFILCWSPYFIFDLLQIYGHIPRNQQMIAFSVFVQSLAPLNSAANPLIYGIFSTRICRNLRQLRVCNWFLTKFCFCCPCAAGPDPRGHPAYSQSMTCSTMGDVTMTSRQELSERYGRDSIHAKEKNVLLRDLQEEMAC